MKKSDLFNKLLEGISSLICLYPSKNRRTISLPTSSISDSLNKDWEKIGLDMWKTITQYKEKNDRIDKSTNNHS